MNVNTIESDPRPEDVLFLERKIYEHNVQFTGISDGKDFAIFLRDDKAYVVGGIYGWTWGATCYIRYLYIPKHMRGQGQGTNLMRRVEAEALERGCRQIVLETHDFQAPGFYSQFDFEIVGRVDQYPRGYQSLTMVKRLTT